MLPKKYKYTPIADLFHLESVCWFFIPDSYPSSVPDTQETLAGLGPRLVRDWVSFLLVGLSRTESTVPVPFCGVSMLGSLRCICCDRSQHLYLSQPIRAHAEMCEGFDCNRARHSSRNLLYSCVIWYGDGHDIHIGLFTICRSCDLHCFSFIEFV